MITEFILYSQVQGKFISVFQIYFKPEQLASLDYTPFFNEDCTVYFENTVISKLISEGVHKQSEYFGVVSHKLKEKVESCRRGPRLVCHYPFDKEYFDLRLRQEMPDVMGFLQYSPHDPVRYFLNIHPELPKHFANILRAMGIVYKPEIINHVFYGNHFVARSEVYEAYFKELLAPAMMVMNRMPELLGDSGYPIDLPENLKKKFGTKHYPYHAFICERLFSYWVNLKKLDVKYY